MGTERILKRAQRTLWATTTPDYSVSGLAVTILKFVLVFLYTTRRALLEEQCALKPLHFIGGCERLVTHQRQHN